MIMIKFSTNGVKSITPGKSTTEVFVDIKYNNGSSTRFSEKIKYGSFFVFFDQSFLSNIGWVSFFEDNEVFHIPPAEKEEILREKYKLYPELHPSVKAKAEEKKKFDFIQKETKKEFDIFDLNSACLDELFNSSFIKY